LGFRLALVPERLPAGDGPAFFVFFFLKNGCQAAFLVEILEKVHGMRRRPLSKEYKEEVIQAGWKSAILKDEAPLEKEGLEELAVFLEGVHHSALTDIVRSGGRTWFRRSGGEF